MTQDKDLLCINTIRILSIDAIEKARSGHPGMPMGAAAMGYVLFTRFMRYNPKDPTWPNRDRFILSAGHGSMLLYSLLHLTGYDLSLEDLKDFRQLGSKTPGHPEYGNTPGVETTTGPLGQGFANGVGMAIAERYMASYFNRPGFPIVDHHIYGIVSDGDLMEGISHEAASLAGHLGLGKIVYLYDSNKISIEGDTSITFTEDVKKRFEAYGWQVLEVHDGNEVELLTEAISLARAELSKPSLIIVHTKIGFGSPNKQGSADSHGEPLGEKEARLTKKNLGWPEDLEFFVPQEVYEHMGKASVKGIESYESWHEMFQRYKQEYPQEAKEWEQWMGSEVPPSALEDLPFFDPDPKGTPTRVASGEVLNILAKRLKNILGGSADLGPSNKTLIKGEKDFQAHNYQGRNLRFGVREHAMGAILNGMALYKGLIPYGGTFLVFSDYMKPAIRLAAMMKLKVIYIFTHDSIGLGEDGPTHQPIEQLAHLRSIPNLVTIRPCDANETVEAWKVALQRKGPVALCLTRQSVPILDRKRLAPAHLLGRGAYVIWEPKGNPPQVVIVATGSEVHIALEAAEILLHKGINARVVSMPSWELFMEQEEAYREQVLLDGSIPKVSVEAGSTFGWERIIGKNGLILGIDRFGLSGPYNALYNVFGLNPPIVAEKVIAYLEKEKGE